MVLRMAESGSPGSLCRTKPVNALPPSGQQLHLLVPKSVTKTPTELRAMVQGFKGVQTGTQAGTKVNVTATNLVPKATGLELRLRGRIDVGTALHFSFYYRILLDLNPYNGYADRSGDDGGRTQPGRLGRAVVHRDAPAERRRDPGAGPTHRSVTRCVRRSWPRPRRQSTASITSINDVKWWTDQGFTLSIRRVAYATTGLTVYPSFCMLG